MTYILCHECTAVAVCGDYSLLEVYSPQGAYQRALKIDGGLWALGELVLGDDLGPDEGECECCCSYTWNPMSVWEKVP